MSSVVDEDTAEAINSGRETLGLFLGIAQEKLQRVFILFVIGMMGTIYALRVFIWDFLKANTKSRMSAEVAENVDIIVRTPFDVILLQVKIGLVIGILFAVPLLLYYAKDPLKRRGYDSVVPIGRLHLAAFILVAGGLFVGGVAYSFLVFFPFMFEFLAVNAIGAQIKPSYGIVLYTQFLLLLMVSFGLAAELPLAMSALTYTEIIPYETFRDKWRYAIVAIFGFGAVFSPPDPFTQIMWAFPLVVLYVFSLALAKVVTNIHRRERTETDASGLQTMALQLLAGTAVVFVAAAAYFRADGLDRVEESVVPLLPARYRPPGPLTTEGLTGVAGLGGELLLALGVAAVAGVLVVGVYSVRVLQQPVVPRDPYERESFGDPTAIDLSELDAQGVRDAPIEPFLDREHEEIERMAIQSKDDGDMDKARALLDRLDEAEAMDAESVEDLDEADAAAGTATADAADDFEPGPGTVDDDDIPQDALTDARHPDQRPDTSAGEDDDENAVAGTAAGMLDAFTEEETTEDDIGGYWYDIRFILESLTSKLFRIVGVFMAVLAVTFYWLYQGGIGSIKEDFLARIDPVVWEAANLSPQDLGLVIALHPVEALVFEVKVSTIVAGLAVLPMVVYYAWPAITERGLASGDRNVFAGWGVALFAGFVTGLALGYAFVAPTMISYLVGDAIGAGLVISYRLKNFFWLIFLTTAGIGILVNIPVTMVLFHLGGIVEFESMYRRWRAAAIGVFALAGVLTPPGVLTMLIVAIPVALAYGVGLGILWLITLPERGWRFRVLPEGE